MKKHAFFFLNAVALFAATLSVNAYAAETDQVSDSLRSLSQIRNQQKKVSSFKALPSGGVVIPKVDYGYRDPVKVPVIPVNGTDVVPGLKKGIKIQYAPSIPENVLKKVRLPQIPKGSDFVPAAPMADKSSQDEKSGTKNKESNSASVKNTTPSAPANQQKPGTVSINAKESAKKPFSFWG